MTEFWRASMTPGRAWPAAHPQTELTTTSALPERPSRSWSTCSGLVSGSTPTAASSLPHGRDGLGVVDRRESHSILLVEDKRSSRPESGRDRFRLVYDFLAIACARTRA